MALRIIVFVTFFGSYFAYSHKRFAQPNIIAIVADDLGWNDVSFHGSNQIPTPNIDALAYNGLILNRHYVLPTCTPSRTAFMTGLYPIKTGMQGYPLKSGEPRGIPLTTKLLPEYLKTLGYATKLIGKWHVGYYTKYHTPTYRGFDTFFGYYNGYIQYFNHTTTQDSVTGYDIHRDFYGSIKSEKVSGYFTDVITREAKQIIETHDITRPLFLQVNHLAPHSADGDETMEVRDENQMNHRFGYIKDRNRRRYASMVQALDDSVGQIMKSLEFSDMLENSIVLFISDNGAQTEGLLENFGSNYPLRGLKFTLFEGGIRGVACLYSPLIKQTGRVINQLIHVTDWLPTLFSAAGGNLNSLPEFDGKNQWPVLQNYQSKARDFILLNIDEVDNLEGALVGDFKLLKKAKKLYGGYYGDDGRGPENPSYNISQVLESDTHKAIQRAVGSYLTPSKISIMRSNSDVVCKQIKNYPDCAQKCLFNIKKDPCETTDVSTNFPKTIEYLEKQMNKYRQELLPQMIKEVDPKSFPRNFKGFWMPWINKVKCFWSCPNNNNFPHYQIKKQEAICV